MGFWSFYSTRANERFEATLTEEELIKHIAIWHKANVYAFIYFFWAVLSLAIGIFLSLFVKAPDWIRNYFVSLDKYVISLDALCFSVILIFFGAIYFFYNLLKIDLYHFYNLKKNIFVRFVVKFFFLVISLALYFGIFVFGSEFFAEVAPVDLGGKGISYRKGKIFELLFYFDVFGVGLFIALFIFIFFLSLVIFFKIKIFPKLGF